MSHKLGLVEVLQRVIQQLACTPHSLDAGQPGVRGLLSVSSKPYLLPRVSVTAEGLLLPAAAGSRYGHHAGNTGFGLAARSRSAALLLLTGCIAAAVHQALDAGIPPASAHAGDAAATSVRRVLQHRLSRRRRPSLQRPTG